MSDSANNLIHVYFMPGMAANPSIFEFIQLPEDQFNMAYSYFKRKYAGLLQTVD